MRIKKTSQYIEGGASLSNVYGKSDSNGYTQEYINGVIEEDSGTFTGTHSNITYSGSWKKFGKVVSMEINSDSNSLPVSSNVTFITLPENIRPFTEVVFTLNSYGTYLGTGWIDTGGNVYYRKTASATTMTRVNICYITN